MYRVSVVKLLALANKQFKPNKNPKKVSRQMSGDLLYLT